MRKQKFDVHIHGQVPQEMEIEAYTPEAAIREALQSVIDRLQFKAFPQEAEDPQLKAMGPQGQIEAPPPEAKERRSAGGGAEKA